MKKIMLSLFSLLLLGSITAAQPGSVTAPADDVEIEIQVSPSTILLYWTTEAKVRVTVHTDVSYSNVFTSASVELDGVSASSVFSDARGNLVAKFNYKEIAYLVKEGTATLTLIATDGNNVTYFGSDDVRVREMGR